MSDKLSTVWVFKHVLWSIGSGSHAELVNKQIQIKSSEQMYSGLMINDFEEKDGSIGIRHQKIPHYRFSGSNPIK